MRAALTALKPQSAVCIQSQLRFARRCFVQCKLLRRVNLSQSSDGNPVQTSAKLVLLRPQPLSKLLSLIWTMEVAPNIAHATVGGDLATSIYPSTRIFIEPNERTPLLATGSSRLASSPSIYTKECLNWRTIGLLLMFIISIVLATYLLWRQTYSVPDNGYKLNLMRHDIWSRAQLHDQALLEVGKVFNVFITHTGGEECSDDNCVDLLHTMQRKYLGELPFNFLMAGDCEIYEARGWQYVSSYGMLPQVSSLVLAFVGDYSVNMPSICQLEMARALLWESQRRMKLQRTYQLYVVRNVTSSGQDADALQQQLKHWLHYAGPWQVK